MTTSNQTPAYTRFAITLARRFAEAGIALTPPTAESPDGIPGPKNWAMLEVPSTGDKVYLTRTRTSDPTVVHTSVPFEEIPSQIVVEDLRGKNGKIEASVTPDVDAIASGLIPVLLERIARGARIRASRRASKAASGTASPAMSWAQAVAPQPQPTTLTATPTEDEAPVGQADSEDLTREQEVRA